MSGKTSRPKLGAHVLARRHVVGGATSVVLHDTRTGDLLQLDERTWQMLAAADGTRDAEGIRLAAAREGARAGLEAVEAFFSDLAQAGMLEPERQAESKPEHALPEGEAAALAKTAHDPTSAERPLERLPDFSLHCDGRGTCCRMYATVIFSPLEAARARALLPEVLGAGERQDRAFLPQYGAGPCAAYAVALRNGRCAYLGEADACAIHARGGAASKPLGCATFPARFFDDETSVRVSVSPECACVLRSVGQDGGAPLVDPAARTRADLPEAIEIERMPERVAVAAGREAPAAEVAVWSRAVAARGVTRDGVGACLGLARVLEERGLELAASIEAFAAPDAWEPMDLAGALTALLARAARRGREDAGWRSERDVARQAAAWIAHATEALLAGELPGVREARQAEHESFYLRAILFGHGLVGARTMAAALRDRATRLLVARAMAAVGPGGDDPAFDEPIALVEAMLRGHGLGAYVQDLP